MIGEVLANRYVIKAVLGEGAMGQVWLVEDTTIGQDVALKVISRRIGATEKSMLEFMQEFRLMTQLRHPNCCEVHDYGLLPDDVPYMTMEVVPGQGIDEVLPLAGERFEHVLSQILIALAYIHQRGFVHCDLKSANVRLRPDGVVKLMDYGLMEFAGRTGGPIKGTLAYMAPEMIKRGLIDQRADLYSVGVLAFEMLTGQVPFDCDKPGDFLRAHLNDTPPTVASLVPTVDPRHERIVRRLLAKDPVERYQSATDVLEDLGVAVTTGIAGTLLTSPLMGRAQEMAKLFVHLARIVTLKPGSTVWLSGPAGIGKSRLVKEFSFNVQLENLPYAVGPNHEFAQSPYGPFVAVLRGLLPAFKESVPEAIADAGPVLARLLPELGGEQFTGELEPGNEKMRLQGAITSLLAALARKRGLVMVLEDWQWADPLSAELLDYLMRNIQDAPLLILVTGRNAPSDASGQPPKVKLVSMALQPLAEAGLRRMVVAMLGTAELDEPLVRQLIEYSAGNPYHVEMLLDHLVTDGLLEKTRGQWVASGEITPERLPKDLRGLLMKKLTALPEDAQRVARIAAVFGYEFGITQLKRVAGLSDDALFQALAQLSQQQIFIQNEDGAYLFAQDQIQDLVYMSMADEEKLRLHTAVGEAMETQLAQLPLSEVPLGFLTSITDQFLRGGAPEKTISYALETGLRNATLFANAEAEHYLEAGLALLRSNESAMQSPFTLKYLRCLGEVRQRAGRLEAARDAYIEGSSLAEDLGDRFLLGRLLTALAKVYQGLDELQAAMDAGERALQISLESEDWSGAARCLLVNCRTRFYLGLQKEAMSDLTQGLELARQGTDKGCIGEALAYMGYMYVASDSGKLGEGVECLNESVAVLGELGDKHGLINALAMLGLAQGKLGDYQGAHASFLKTLQLSQEVGNHLEACTALVNLATNALELGDFAEALKMARDGAQEAMRVQSTYMMGISIMVEASAHAHLGHFNEAKALLQVAHDIGSELNHKYMETRMLQYRGDIMLMMGNFDDAQATAERLQQLMRETGNLEPQGRLYALLGEMFARQGDNDGARNYLEAAQSIAELGMARGAESRVLKAKAWLSMQTENFDEAREIGEHALAVAESVSAVFVIAEVHGLLGELALATGHGSTARAHFETMTELATRHGYEILEAQGLFGRAASAPYAPEAAELAAQAKVKINAIHDALAPDARSWFLSYPERLRVLGGNHIAFSLPTVQAKPAPKQGLNQEMWGMMDR